MGTRLAAEPEPEGNPVPLNTHLSPAFARLLWSDALMVLALMVVPGYKAFMALEHHEIEGWYQRAYPKAFNL